MNTKYGFIAIIIEDGKKKIDFSNCKFVGERPDITMISMLRDKEFLENLMGY